MAKFYVLDIDNSETKQSRVTNRRILMQFTRPGHKNSGSVSTTELRHYEQYSIDDDIKIINEDFYSIENSIFGNRITARIDGPHELEQVGIFFLKAAKQLKLDQLSRKEKEEN